MDDVPAERQISMRELLDLIEDETGRRIATSTVWSYVSRGQMPAPVDRREGRAWWDIEAVRAWLLRRRSTPGKARDQLVAEHQARIRSAAEDLDQAVAAALKAKLSWAQIGEAIPSPEGGHLTRQGAQIRFRDVRKRLDQFP